MEELVMMLNESEKNIEGSDEEQFLDEKISHLSAKEAKSETIQKSLPTPLKIWDHLQCQSVIVLN